MVKKGMMSKSCILTLFLIQLCQKVRPADWDYRDELADIIAERYGAK